MAGARQRLAAAILALPVAAGGCGARVPDVKVDAQAYSQPQGWQTECIGRWLIDVPAPVDFGASYFTTGSYAEFFDYTVPALRDSIRARGGVSVGPVAFTESVPLVERVPFNDSTLSGLRYMAMRLSQYHFSRDYPEDAYKRLLERTDVQSAWAGPGRFQIGFHSPEDQRGRFYWKDRTQARAEPPKEPSAEPLAREVLAKLVPRYAVRKPGQTPQGPGVCTPHGFFADPAASTELDTRISVSFVDPRYANLVLHVDIKTRMPHTEKVLIPTENIRQAITPWQAAEQMAKEDKRRCRSQQGTASQDLFGCSFAGATGISNHSDVQYLKLANGQEARVMAISYPPSISNYKAYEVIVETAGKKGSVAEPRIVVTAEGIDELTDEKAFRGKKPPPIEQAYALAVTLAKSLRPRPGAVDAARPVADTFVKMR
jgi:hypothetical protein